jgi:hypothetical protein
MDSMQEVDDVSKNLEWCACEKNLKKCEKVHESCLVHQALKFPKLHW